LVAPRAQKTHRPVRSTLGLVAPWWHCWTSSIAARKLDMLRHRMARPIILGSRAKFSFGPALRRGCISVSSWSFAASTTSIAALISRSEYLIAFVDSASMAVSRALYQLISVVVLRPSVQPDSASPCVNPKSRAFASGSLSAVGHQHADPPHAMGPTWSRPAAPGACAGRLIYHFLRYPASLR
jgi:hypothetical protein